nr:lipopolysaccharide assembly protein LapA domain-containing protein [Wenzhouxiangella sp. XN79A]
MRWLFALIVLAGVALGLVLGVLNADPVTLDLGLVRWTTSLGAVVAAASGAGLLVGLLLGGLVVRTGRRRASSTAGRDLRVSSSTDE